MNKIEIVLVIMVVATVVNMVTSGTPGYCEKGNKIKNDKCEDERCCNVWCNGDNSVCKYPR